MLATVWTLWGAGALTGGATWVCGLHPPEVALGRLWWRTRPQTTVIDTGFAGLADACLAALDHRPGPMVLVIDSDIEPAAWEPWATVGPVCTVRIAPAGPLDPQLYPLQETWDEDLLTNLDNLPSLAQTERDAPGNAWALRLRLAQLYREFGAATVALKLLDRCTDTEGEWAAHVALERGRSLAEIGRWTQAVAALESARDQVGQTGPEGIVAAEIDVLLADCYRLAGRWREALQLARDGLRLRAELAGLDSEWVAVALDRLGRLHAKLGNAEQAERAYRAALTVLEQLDAGDPAAQVLRERWYEALDAKVALVDQDC